MNYFEQNILHSIAGMRLEDCADQGRLEERTAEALHALSQGMPPKCNTMTIPLLTARNEHKVSVTSSFVEALTGGVPVRSSACLQRSVVRPFAAVAEYYLERHNRTLLDSVGWILVAKTVTDSALAFFNFKLRLWQPLHFLKSGGQAPAELYTYIAFQPMDMEQCEEALSQPRRLFIKLGYHWLPVGLEETIIGYVEKKTQELRITNKTNAGILLSKIPSCYQEYDRPGPAAELDLKTLFLNCEDLKVTPSNKEIDSDDFSSSLEYLIVEGDSVINRLVDVFRRFTGDASLIPYMVRADVGEGRMRVGPKRLRPWEDGLENALSPKRQHAEGDSFDKLHLRGNTSAVRNALREAEERSKEADDAYQSGQVRAAIDKYKASLESLNRAGAFLGAPKDVISLEKSKALAGQAQCFKTTREWSEALKLATEAVEMNEQCANAWHVLGAIYLHKSDLVFRTTPRDAASHSHIEEVTSRSSIAEVALQYLEKGLKLDPSNAELKTDMARAVAQKIEAETEAMKVTKELCNKAYDDAYKAAMLKSLGLDHLIG